MLPGIFAPAVGIEVKTAQAERDIVLEAGDDELPAAGAAITSQAAPLDDEAIAGEQLVELVAGQRSRPAGADQFQIALGKTRLNRREVNGLQQLRLQQFTRSGDFVARQDGIRIGQQPVGGEIRRIDVDRFPAFGKRKLLETQIAVNAPEARAARGEVGIEQ